MKDPKEMARCVTELRGYVSPEDVVRIVCRYAEITEADLVSKSRHPRVTSARELIGLLFRWWTVAGFEVVALCCGRTNHSTIATAVRRIQRRLVQGEDLPGFGRSAIGVVSDIGREIAAFLEARNASADGKSEGTRHASA